MYLKVISLHVFSVYDSNNIRCQMSVSGQPRNKILSSNGSFIKRGKGFIESQEKRDSSYRKQKQMFDSYFNGYSFSINIEKTASQGL